MESGLLEARNVFLFFKGSDFLCWFVNISFSDVLTPNIQIQSLQLEVLMALGRWTVPERPVALQHCGGGTGRPWARSSLQAQPLPEGDWLLQTDRNDAWGLVESLGAGGS